MQIVCPKCNSVIGEATSVARLILTAHCPYDGYEFGVAVVPPEQKELLPATAATGVPVAAGSVGSEVQVPPVTTQSNPPTAT